jgi:hypothetical protein
VTPQYVDITENFVGTIPKLTWGANIGGTWDYYTFHDGIPNSKVTLGRIGIGLESIYTESTTPNSQKLDALDAKISNFTANGIEPLLIVASMPRWLSSCFDRYSVAVCDSGTVYKTFPPNVTKMSSFREIVKNLTAHVKNNVKYYEIWNEPDNQQFWNGTYNEYVYLLKNISTAIRAGDTDADTKILAPAIMDNDLTRPDLSRTFGMLNKSCMEANSYFDIVSFHAYWPSSFPLEKWYINMDRLVRNLSAMGCGNKPIWCSECGIRPSRITWSYVDVLSIAKEKKILLDYNLSAQVYFPFVGYVENPFGFYEGIYNISSTSRIFTPIGKYYQVMGQLKFYGNNLSIISNIQNNISQISFIAVRNDDNKVITQLTNNFSTTKDVQINFQNIKNITVYESSSSQIFSSPTFIGRQSSFTLSLRPYSTYIIEAKPLST